MGGKSTAKNRKSRKSGEVNENNEDVQNTEYEAEKIVDRRKVNGKVQYKIHWEGFSTDEETWENESQMNCDELIEKYLNEKKTDGDKVNDSESDDGDKAGGNDNKKGPKKGAIKRAKSSKKESFSKKTRNESVSEQDEYEVERIIEMHTLRNGKHEFLVRWHGFGKAGDTWEPEENLKGTEALERFLEKVKKAKELPQKELRVNRSHTDRFTAMPQGDKRRQSKRNANRQRVKYYDAE